MATAQRNRAEAAAAAAPATGTALPPAPVGALSRGTSSTSGMDVPLSALPLSALTPPPGTGSPFAVLTTRSIAAAVGPVAAAAELGPAPGAAALAARGIAGGQHHRPGAVPVAAHGAMPFMVHAGMMRGYSAPSGPTTDVAAALKYQAHLAGQSTHAPAQPAAANAHVNSAAATGQRVAVPAKPRTVPPPPYFLTNFVIALVCKLGEVRTCVESALTSSNVDYDYIEAKWKANCYLYRSTGFVNFCVRLFTQPGENGDTYLVELQRRKGCHMLFADAYDKILAQLMRAGVVQSDCPAVLRARAAAPLNGHPPATLALAGAGSDAKQAPRSMSAPVRAGAQPAAAAAAGDEQGTGMGYGSDDTEASTDSVGAGPVVPDAEATRIVDAFAPLCSMLQSDYDDVSTPAAQSIASLSVSRRVRSALGMKAAAARTLHRAGSGASTASTATDAGTPPALDSTLLVTQLFEALLLRLTRMYPNLRSGQMVHVASVECRTACAIAIANLAQNTQCAEALAAMCGHVRLMDAVAYVPHSAATAALRRECLHAVHAILASVPSAARSANDLRGRARMSAISNAFHGMDGVVDHYARAITELLEAAPSSAGTNGAAPPAQRSP